MMRPLSTCIYYQRVFRDGNLDPQIGIYRDPEDGPCEICVLKEESWEDRVVNEVVFAILNCISCLIITVDVLLSIIGFSQQKSLMGAYGVVY